MKIGKELDELHARTDRVYRTAVLSIKDRFTISKTLSKHMEAISYNLNTYELMQRELEKIASFSKLAINTEELSTIEREIKELYDNFWK